MDRSSRWKISKETHVLNDTLDETDLTDIFRTLHPNAEEYTIFSRAHGIFFRTDHMLGHKLSPGKFKKMKIISNIYPDHNTMILEIHYKKKKKTLSETQIHGN